jgi:hypothetical protein
MLVLLLVVVVVWVFTKAWCEGGKSERRFLLNCFLSLQRPRYREWDPPRLSYTLPKRFERVVVGIVPACMSIFGATGYFWHVYFWHIYFWHVYFWHIYFLDVYFWRYYTVCYCHCASLSIAYMVTTSHHTHAFYWYGMRYTEEVGRGKKGTRKVAIFHGPNPANSYWYGIRTLTSFAYNNASCFCCDG